MKDQLEFKVTWLPFLLNPEMPSEGIDRKAYFLKKFGVDIDKDSPMKKHISDCAKEVGITFNYSKMIPSTIKAHQLIDCSLEQGKQNEVSEMKLKNLGG